MDMLGISQNAYTSDNEVVFHMKGLDKSLNEWRSRYIDLISEFNVSKEDFEKERKIIYIRDDFFYGIYNERI